MTTQLPKITPEDNPFYVPDEYEIFKMKEREKQLKKEERTKFQELKVSEKGVKRKGQFTIRKINEIGSESLQDKETRDKLKIVDAADSAVKNRVRQKEPMYQYIDKKREMLLFQMLIDHKRAMIDEFEKLTRLHRKGLEKSEQLLEEDLEIFNKFLDANKNNLREATKEAERETKMKQEKSNEIKSLLEHKTDLTTKNQQKRDNLEDLWKYKKFFDQITPKDFAQGKKLDLEQFLQEESDDEFEAYFKEPRQLEDIFQQLEERNLFLIANTKEREQMVEELKQKYESKKTQLEDKFKIASLNKQDLLKQIEQVNEQVKILKVIRSDGEATNSLKSLETQIATIYKKDINQGSDLRKDITGLEMLKELERKLSAQIMEIQYFRTSYQNHQQKNPNNTKEESAIEKAEKACIDSKKEQMKSKKAELDKSEQQRKQLEQEKDRGVKKRNGRPIMVRGWIPQKEVQEQVVDDMTEEEKERIKYFT